MNTDFVTDAPLWALVLAAFLTVATYAIDLLIRWKSIRVSTLRSFPFTGVAGFTTAFLVTVAGVAVSTEAAPLWVLGAALALPVLLAALGQALFRLRISRPVVFA